MHRVLGILEIVRIIIHEADNKTTVACTRICTLWSDVALDKIWRKIEFPGHLFMTCDPDLKAFGTEYSRTTITWDQRIRLGDSQARRDWAHFASYAKRIRSASFVFKNEIHRAHIYAHFVNSCPLSPILPCIRQLDLMIVRNDNSFAHIAKFCGGSLDSLTLRIHGSVWDESTAAFGKEIAVNAPNITHFAVYRDFGVLHDTVVHGFVHALSNLKRLQHVELGTFAIMPQIISCIARLPTINKLTIKESFRTPVRFHRVFQKEFPHELNIFPALLEIDIASESTHFISILRSQTCFQKLCRARFDFIDAATERRTSELISSVVTTCQDLVELSIKQFYDPWEHKRLPGTFTLDTLKPLKDLRHLTSLTLHHTLTNCMTNDDLIQLIRDCPRLEKLWLCPQWLKVSLNTSRADNPLPSSEITLDALRQLTHQPNNIRSLRLCVYIDADDDALSTPALDVGNNLANLTSIGFGFSIIDFDKDDDHNLCRIGHVIKKCLPPGCRHEEEADVQEQVGYEFECVGVGELREDLRKWDRVWTVIRA